MKIYIQAIDFQLWKVILKGPHAPMIKIDGVDVPKLEEEWDEYDMKLRELNAKAMNLLYCALDSSEFNRIFTCSLAKKI